jgi:hypothetical protein
MFQQPAFGFAEAAWHWSFAAATFGLVAFGFVEYLDSLPVGPGDLVLLKTNRFPLIARAVADIVQGSGPRLAECVVLLVCSLTTAWVALASWGRAATTCALLTHFRAPASDSGSHRTLASCGFRPLLGLNFLRIIVTAAAAVGSLAPWFSSAIRSAADDDSRSGAWLGLIFVIVSVWVCWYLLNWIFSLAALFAVVGKCDTWGAIRAAVEFSSLRAPSVLAVNAWFGFAHFVGLVFTVSAMVFSLSFLSVLPPGYAAVAALFVLLVYFLIVDFLRVGRLAAYVAILEGLETPPIDESDSVHSGLGYSWRRDRVDPDELILSDVPAPAP